MSVKRQSTTELNHENWDQDNPADRHEIGTFNPAPKDVLEKRVIRTAKRRSNMSSGDERKNTVFSRFGGFNKAQPKSFDFLANLTNDGTPNIFGSTAAKSETAEPSSLFGAKSITSSSGISNVNSALPSNLFSSPISSGGFFNTPATTSLNNTNTSDIASKSFTSSPGTTLFSVPSTSVENKATGNVILSKTFTNTGLFGIPTASNESNKTFTSSPGLFGIPMAPKDNTSNTNVTSKSFTSSPITGAVFNMSSPNNDNKTDVNAMTSKPLSTIPNSSGLFTMSSPANETKTNTNDTSIKPFTPFFSMPSSSSNENKKPFGNTASSGGLFSVPSQSNGNKKLFTSSPSSGGLFSMPLQSNDEKTTTNDMSGKPISSKSGFGVVTDSTTKSFISSKPDSTIGNLVFKAPSTSTLTKKDPIVNSSTAKIDSSSSQVTSTIFGVPSTNVNKSLSNAKTANTSNFPILAVPSSSSNNASSTTKSSSSVKFTNMDSNNDKQLIFYSKLKDLNESVLAWIQKHVEETPLCLLSPIFKDYETHLKEILEESGGLSCNDINESHNKDNLMSALTKNKETTFQSKHEDDVSSSKQSVASASSSSALFKNINSASVFGVKSNTGSKESESPPKFSFGYVPSNLSSNKKDTTYTDDSKNKDVQTIKQPSLFTNTESKISGSPNFTFGIKTTVSSTTATPTFSYANKTTSQVNMFTPPKKDLSLNSKNEDNVTSSKQLSTPSTKFGSNLNSGGTGSIFGNTNTSLSVSAASPPSFQFGIITSSVSTTTATTTFSFADKTAGQTNVATSDNFKFSLNNAQNTISPPFSFQVGKPFSFNSNIETKEDQQSDNNDEDEPPKTIEYTPIVEENSVFDKKCKIFIKEGTDFKDMGVGTLYIKKIEESDKHQLLVRANNTLRNILVNLILVDAIPTRRVGKNNVMMVCIPTPESNPPPTTLFIRVKTGEEADELLATLDKYKT